MRFDVTDPYLLIPLQQTSIIQGIPDQRETQPSPNSDCLPESSQPSSNETTTKEPSDVLPVSPIAGTDSQSFSSSSSESTSGTSSSYEASSTTTSLDTGTTSTSSSAWTSPEICEIEHSFKTILGDQHEKLGHAVCRSTMEDAHQHILIMQKVFEQKHQPRPVSAPPMALAPLPPFPQRYLSDMLSQGKVQAGNTTAKTVPHKTSTPEKYDRLQDIPEEPPQCRIGHSRVKELTKYFTPSSDEEEQSRINTRTRQKKLFPPIDNK